MGDIVENCEELIKRIEEFRDQKKSIVVVNGCFDAFHPGHEFFLSQAGTFGDILVVLVNSDEYIRNHKGEGRPLNELHKRLRDVAEHIKVDLVLAFDEATPLKELTLIKPDVYGVSEEYWPDPVEKGTVLSLGGQLRCIKRIPGHSTTELLRSQGRVRETTHGKHRGSCPGHR